MEYLPGNKSHGSIKEKSAFCLYRTQFRFIPVFPTCVPTHSSHKKKTHSFDNPTPFSHLIRREMRRFEWMRGHRENCTCCGCDFNCFFPEEKTQHQAQKLWGSNWYIVFWDDSASEKFSERMDIFSHTSQLQNVFYEQLSTISEKIAGTSNSFWKITKKKFLECENVFILQLFLFWLWNSFLFLVCFFFFVYILCPMYWENPFWSGDPLKVHFGVGIHWKSILGVGSIERSIFKSGIQWIWGSI